MRIKLVKLKDLSGNKTTFYSVYYNKDEITLFRKFLEENINLLKDETIEIYNRLRIMGHEVGARQGNFKFEEGAPGDMVCALFDMPGKKLRLYCIRYSENLVVLGGGGIKPKRISALQDDPNLKHENKKVVEIGKLIELRKSEGEIYISKDGFKFISINGTLELKDDYYDE